MNLTDLLETIDATRPAWQQHAACRGMNPEIFFRHRGHTITEARQTCCACPVRTTIRDWAHQRDITIPPWAP